MYNERKTLIQSYLQTGPTDSHTKEKKPGFYCSPRSREERRAGGQSKRVPAVAGKRARKCGTWWLMVWELVPGSWFGTEPAWRIVGALELRSVHVLTKLPSCSQQQAQNNNHGSFRPLHSCPQNSCPPNSLRQRQRHTTFRPHHSRFFPPLFWHCSEAISLPTRGGALARIISLSVPHWPMAAPFQGGAVASARQPRIFLVASLAQRVTGSALRKSSYQRSSSVGMERDGLVGSCR